MEPIEELVGKLQDALYDNKPKEKLLMLKKLVQHHDRAAVYEQKHLITAILRTLSEVIIQKKISIKKKI